MTVSDDNAIARPFESSREDIPVRELVVAWLVGPVANAVAALLLPLRIPPPAIVLTHAATGLAAAAALGAEALVAAALLLQLKTVLDGVDGRLARATGRVTLLGRFLDTEADFAVTVAVFVALASVTGQPWLAAAALVALTLTLSADFNAVELYREANDNPPRPLPASGSVPERVLEAGYRLVFAPQDRLVRAIAKRRLERVLRNEGDPVVRQVATLAYHDRATLAILANLGFSTQLLALGTCLVLGVPTLYLWLALGQVLLLPTLQLRREWLARRVRARARRYAAPRRTSR
jgi:archaetidylinositol phosphate synthase